MSVSVQIGLLLSLATAFASVLGFLYKHRGAIAMPTVDMQKPLRTSFVLFKNPWYTLGIVIATVGWGFHVGALALAPISLVQATIAGGLVLLTVTADRLFAHEVTRREWIGVALAALGLAFLAATLGDTADGGALRLRDVTPRAVPRDRHRRRARRRLAWRRATCARASCFGVSAGLFWAASDTAIKALSDGLGDESIVAILFHSAGPPHRGRLDRGPRRLGPEPSGRQGGPGYRAHQRRREHAHDRRRPDRLRRAAARRAARSRRCACWPSSW